LSKTSSKVLTKEPRFALLVLEVYAYIHHQIHLGSAGETSGSRICETMGSVGARQPLLTSTVPGITLVGEKRPADTDREGERNCDF